MTFCIISHVIHTPKDGNYYGYGPYIKEMNIWVKNAERVIVVAPLESRELNAMHMSYHHANITFIPVPHFSFTSFKNSCKALLVLPFILWKIAIAFRQSDHLHLRCPGNMGLLGAWVQLFFPSKKKTAKYAGNWDPKANQPLTYRWQRTIVSNPILTKNMQVLVYGEWPNQTSNVKPFFTASYPEGEPLPNPYKSLHQPLSFIFVGSLAPGKRPVYAIQMVEKLKEKGIEASLDLYGVGAMQQELEHYIQEHQLSSFIHLKGPIASTVLKSVYATSHFLILPSKSEGWPKVVAEALFWGCIPVVTPISCVPNMLAHGARGCLLSLEIGNDVAQLMTLVQDEKRYNQMRENGWLWSRQYTTDAFENEIKLIMQT